MMVIQRTLDTHLIMGHQASQTVAMTVHLVIVVVVLQAVAVTVVQIVAVAQVRAVINFK